MAVSPRVKVGDKLTDHPVLAALPDDAKLKVKKEVDNLFAQASCAYQAIPCPRNYTLFPPAGVPAVAVPAETDQRARDSLITFFPTGPETTIGVPPACACVAPVVFEGRELYLIERTSDDIVVFATKPVAQTIGRTRVRSAPLSPDEPSVPPAPAGGPPAADAPGPVATPRPPTISIPANFCGGFYGPVAVGGDRGVSVVFGANVSIFGISLGAEAFISGQYFVEGLNASPVGGPCAAGSCGSETGLNVSVRVGIEATLFVRAVGGLTFIPGVGPVPGLPQVGGFFGIAINTEAFADCLIPAP